MQWYDEKKINKEDTKVNKILMISIIITIVAIILTIMLMIIISKNTDRKVVLVNGENKNEIFDLLQFEKKDDGDYEVWIPIKEIATYLGYKGYNGEYNSVTEDKNKCYVISVNKEEGREDTEEGKKEVANFELDSNIISKLDLTETNSEYEYCEIEDKVIQIDGELYTTIEGIEKACNVSFEYDKEKSQITIYTLDYLVDFYTNAIKQGKYSGCKELDTKYFANQKSIFEDMLVIKSDNGKYGVVNSSTREVILESKYDEIKYLQFNSTFLVLSNKKYAIVSSAGKTLVNPEYDELKLMDSKNNYYVAKKNNLYGVIDGKGKEIIYLENRQIGLDSSVYQKNGIKSGYILFDKLIPVLKNKKWGFYDIKGNKIGQFKYEGIGCNSESGNSIYGLLALEDYNFVVVKYNNKYSFITEEGKDDILPFEFDTMYIKVWGGQTNYYMKSEGKQYNIIRTLENMGIKKKNSKDTEVFETIDDDEDKNTTVTDSTSNTNETNKTATSNNSVSNENTTTTTNSSKTNANTNSSKQTTNTNTNSNKTTNTTNNSNKTNTSSNKTS